MAFITSITRLPPAPPTVDKGRSVAGIDRVERTGLLPIAEPLPASVGNPDHLLQLSRKLARQSRDEHEDMAGSSGDGLGPA